MPSLPRPGLPRPGLPRHCRRALRRNRRGTAALEFALTVPVLIFLLMGMYDLSIGWITWRRLETSATAVGQIATMLAVQSDSTNWLTSTSTGQAWQAATAINAAMPETMASGANYAVVLTEVYFTSSGCGTNADSTPNYCVGNVLWSKVVLGNGTTALSTRPCGQQSQLADTAAPVQTGLPASAFQGNPILVVDVAYTYTPLFLASLFGQFPMRWMAYFPSRSGTSIAAQAIGYGSADASGTLQPDPGSYCQPVPDLSTPSSSAS